jgi:hypothetical protein
MYTQYNNNKSKNKINNRITNPPNIECDFTDVGKKQTISKLSKLSVVISLVLGSNRILSRNELQNLCP